MPDHQHTPDCAFEYHAPTSEHVERIQTLREACKTLRHVIDEVLPEGSPEKTLAVRKLEECSMWGNKAIVFS